MPGQIHVSSKAQGRNLCVATTDQAGRRTDLARIDRSVLGRDHPSTLSISLQNINPRDGVAILLC